MASVGHASDVIEVSVREANPRLRPFHVTGQGPQHPKSDARTDDVLDFFERFVEPYLQPRIPRDSPLASASRAEHFFSGLRCKADSSAQEAIGALEGLCEQRRQLALQARLHFWLHCWLTVHAPLSFALLFLLMLHAWVAIMYW